MLFKLKIKNSKDLSNPDIDLNKGQYCNQCKKKSAKCLSHDVTWRENAQCNVKNLLHNEYVLRILKQTCDYRKYTAPKFSESRLDQKEMLIFIKRDKYSFN